MAARDSGEADCVDINVPFDNNTYNSSENEAQGEESPSTGTSVVYTTKYTTNTTTTTTTARDLKRPITSRVTAAILLALLAGPATTIQLASDVERVMGEPIRAQDVRPYLRYYRKLGWVTSHSPYWSLTEEGMKFVLKYRDWLLRLVGDSSRKSRLSATFVWERKLEETFPFEMKGERKLSNTLKLKFAMEKIRRYLRNRDEEDVMRLLLENYFETGSTYMYLDELAEMLLTTPSWLYQEVLRKMKSRKLVYVWKDGKVGLGLLAKRLLGIEHTRRARRRAE